MNGLTRAPGEAGALAVLERGADEGAAADAGVGAAIDGFAVAAGGVEEVAAAGGVAAVCASAPGPTRGSPTSAPAIQIRSIMRQNPTP